MGFRFRKSFKIAPGVKVNFNKKSTGVTFGGKGFHYTVNSKGKKTTSVGIPGTGLSYSTTSDGSSKKKTKKSQGSTNGMNTANAQKWYQKTGYIILLLVLFFPVGLFLMWKYTNWNKYVKIAISALFALFFIIGIASPSDSDEPTNSNSIVDSSTNEATNDEYISTVEGSSETTTSVTTTQAETTTQEATTVPETTTEKQTTTERETTTQKSTGRTVYRTKSGECYHYSSTCPGKNGYAVTLDEAIAAGKRPCEKCVY